MGTGEENYKMLESTNSNKIRLVFKFLILCVHTVQMYRTGCVGRAFCLWALFTGIRIKLEWAGAEWKSIKTVCFGVLAVAITNGSLGRHSS